MHPPSRVEKLIAPSLLILVLALLPLLAREPQAAHYLQRQDISGVRGGNLVVAVNSDPTTFNRMLAASLANAIVADCLSADLVHINRSSMELEPSLAEKWEVDKDGRTYTIHIRQGLVFSDGSAFTADDVVFSFQALRDPAAVLAGQVQIDGAFPSVSRIDPQTVRLAFPRTVGMGLRCLDSVPMLPKHRLLRSFEEGKIASAWGPAAQPQEIAGLGPFRLKEYQRGVRVVLERNPYYWKKDRSGQALPYLNSITFLIIPDRNAEALRFQAGELDIVNTLTPENYASLRRYQKERGYTLRDLGPGLLVDFLWFNLNPVTPGSGRTYVDPEKKILFEQARFRQAVSCGLDRDGMAKSILLGLGGPQFGPISSGNKLWYYKDTPRIPFDPTHAKELLSQAGLRDADGDGVVEFGNKHRPLEIDLLTTRGSVVREKMAQVIKENLSKIGIRVNTQLVLTNELVERLLTTFEYEAILFGFSPTDVVPDSQTDFWYSSGKNHFWHPGQSKPQRSWEAEMDSQIAGLVRNLDPVTRKKSFDRVQEIWAREMPAIPTMAADIISGFSNKVGNTRPSILPPYLLWNAEELTKRADALNVR